MYDCFVSKKFMNDAIEQNFRGKKTVRHNSMCEANLTCSLAKQYSIAVNGYWFVHVCVSTDTVN